MSEKRRANQGVRYSPYYYDRRPNRAVSTETPPVAKQPHVPAGSTIAEEDFHGTVLSTSSSSAVVDVECVKENSDHGQYIDVGGVNDDDEIVIADVGTSLIEIAKAIRSYNFQCNIDVLDYTPTLTQQIHSLDVIDILNVPMNEQEVRDCMAGLSVIVNRLMAENRYLLREIQSLRSSHTVEHVHRFDSLAFRKRNITGEYVYPGDQLGIPAVDFLPIVERFDLNASRRNEGAINTIRRFVKYLLENIIPLELQSKFTLRERSGVEHLIECPSRLVLMVREISLEAVNLAHSAAITEEDKEKREDLGDYINKFIKYALQELRRIPRKAKKTAAEWRNEVIRNGDGLPMNDGDVPRPSRKIAAERTNSRIE